MNSRRYIKDVALVVLVVLVITTAATWSVWETWTRPKTGLQPHTSLRLAFYYPWFPGHWNESTHYHPALGFYNSSDPNVILQHVRAMKYAGLDGGIVSWWGRNNTYGTDTAFSSILEASKGTGFRWAAYYELEGHGNPNVTRIQSDLVYLHDHFANHENYLHMNGRWALFVYSDAEDDCSMATRWDKSRGITPDVCIVLRVFDGYGNCTLQPDGWHQYSAINGEDSQPNYSYTISPGFWSAVNKSSLLKRNPARWQKNIEDMMRSGATFQLVTSFNEWGEGTAIESAEEWSTPRGYGAYLDALHFNGGLNGVGCID